MIKGEAFQCKGTYIKNSQPTKEQTNGSCRIFHKCTYWQNTPSIIIRKKIFDHKPENDFVCKMHVHITVCFFLFLVYHNTSHYSIVVLCCCILLLHWTLQKKVHSGICKNYTEARFYCSAFQFFHLLRLAIK